MDIPNSPKPNCIAAIFTCSCCNYSTTIYSDVELVEINEDVFDINSKGEETIMGFIYRDDLDITDPIHPQCTYTPLRKYNCTSWDDPSLKIHWTEQPVCCMACDKNTMQFVEYTVGLNTQLLYERYLNPLKPSLEPTGWIDKNGNSYILINGNGSKFSAT